MDAGRWQRVQEVFEGALAVDVEARDDFLDQACFGDAELRDEVASLLHAHDRAQDTTFIHRPIASIGDADSSSADDLEGLVDLGRYRLVRRLGLGGMGSVYLGFRSDDAYQQHVAIKVVRRDLAHADLIRRFTRERQILAQLDHANIARLLDGGTTPDGRPYLVMTYVEGETIKEYCSRRDLSVEARLRLFLKVCAAVHFAHQNLVVHRDIKPGNVLVDAQGEPKLLDFGIAKLLDTEHFPGTVVATTPGMRLMTPVYASPEQVRGHEVSTSSDVYALGVLLYELLAGVRPFAIESMPTDEAVRHVLEVTPYKPSTAVLRGPRGGESTEVTPSAVDARRSRTLRGDLDTIIMTALAKEPDRRYASAEALGRDLDRYLRGLPVAARGDSMGYRFSRFVRRNALLVSISAAALIGLIALSLSLLLERQRTVDQRDRATAVSRFMTELFERADPAHARGETITAREVLERGRGEIEALSDRPVLQADLLITMGRVHRSIGLLEPAEAMLRRALGLRREQHAGDHVEVAESLELLGIVMHDLEATEEAVPVLEEAVAMRQRLHGENDIAVADSLEFLGSTLHRAHRFDEARPAYEQAVAISRANPDDIEKLARRITALGTLERDSGDPELAASLAREGLALLESEPDADRRPPTAWLLTNLGTALLELGQLREAESALRRAETIMRRVYQDPNPRFSHALSQLGLVLERLGDENAEPILEEALEMRRAVFGANHPRVAETLNSLAYVALDKKENEKAESLFEEALRIKQETLPGNHRDVAAAYGNLALPVAARGDQERAAGLYQKALDIYRGHGDLFLKEYAIMLGRLAAIVLRSEPDRGLAMHEEAVAAMASAIGDDHPDVGIMTLNLGFSYTRAGRHDEAGVRYRRALEIVEPTLGDEHPATKAIHRALERQAKRSE